MSQNLLIQAKIINLEVKDTDILVKSSEMSHKRSIKDFLRPK